MKVLESGIIIFRRWFSSNKYMMSKQCYLRSVNNPEKIIRLPHKEAINVGRNPQTGLRDLLISRKHLMCTADVDQEKVLVKLVGRNPCGCNGFALMPNETYHLKHGDRVEVRLGAHEYEIVFDKACNVENDGEPKAKKPKLEEADQCIQDVQFTNRGTWESIDNKELLIYTSENCVAKPVIASFDIDGTVIRTKSGARFPKDPSDWVLNFPVIPDKFKELYRSNYKIVFFTNQLKLGRDSSSINDFKGKIEKIIAKIAVPIQVFIATGKSMYRKPLTGMWTTLTDHKNDGVKIDVSKSFYVGDAAGRKKDWAPKKPKDHSICDRLFALNLGLKFRTPEEYFLGARSVPFTMPEFDPRVKIDLDYPQVDFDEQEVVLMVGVQGSGKSHYCKKHLVPRGYVYISRDKLGTWQKCVKVLEECLSQKKSAVIDNTNPDKETRRKYIDVAKKHNTPIRCFLMATSHKQAQHNNRFRELTDKSHQEVSDIILNAYRKQFQEPEVSEGFSEIVKIPCIPKFDSSEHEKLYTQFLLES